MNDRKAKLDRNTSETKIAVEINLDGRGKYSVETGLPFMNHMLELFSRHSLVDISMKAVGDLHVDYHHTVEDLGLALGTAVDKALGSRNGISRYGSAVVPMDESLSQAAVDLGGRPFFVMRMSCRRRKILEFDLRLIEEFFRAFTVQARMNLHLSQIYGDEPHHAYESVFKAFARAFKQACERDSRVEGVPSSKGSL